MAVEKGGIIVNELFLIEQHHCFHSYWVVLDQALSLPTHCANLRHASSSGKSSFKLPHLP